MASRSARLLGVSALIVASLTTSACSRVVGHQGFIADQTLIDGIQPGIDNRESVTKTLGRPSFTGQFSSNDWYYLSRSTKTYAFATPKPSEQMVLRVRFDAAGNVASVDKRGMEQIASISPEGDKTPTLGKERSFFDDLFGNIGQVGSVGQGGSTTDNPN